MAVKVSKDYLRGLIDDAEKDRKTRFDRDTKNYEKRAAKYKVALVEHRTVVIKALMAALDKLEDIDPDNEEALQRVVSESSYDSYSVKVPRSREVVQPSPPLDPEPDYRRFQKDRAFLDAIEGEFVQVGATDTLARYLR